jgi:hypothetical protein
LSNQYQYSDVEQRMIAGFMAKVLACEHTVQVDIALDQ